MIFWTRQREQKRRQHGIGDNGTRDVIGLHLYTSPRR
jgi:hypothetical protein